MSASEKNQEQQQQSPPPPPPPPPQQQLDNTVAHTMKDEYSNSHGASTESTPSPSPARSSFTRKSESSPGSNSINSNKRPHNDYDYRQRVTYSESDQELYIRSLSESLMIHKEIVERIENEKEQYMENVERERKQERETQRVTLHALEEQRREYEKLQMAHHGLLSDMEKKKQEYKRMETNYYSHVRQIRATDDDLSTVQSEISHLFSQIGNLCMSLRSKVDREAGTAFALERWPDKEEVIKGQLLKEGEETLDTGYIGLLIEKYLIEVLLELLLRQPLHPGVSINDAYQQVEAWFAQRNPEWATRLRQQASALVAKQPDDEESMIEEAKQQIVQSILEMLGRVCPKVKDDANQEKKVANIINRAAKLNLAIKGQELPVDVLPIEEGVASFDSDCMKPASKGKAEGTVLLVIAPAFTANDPSDAEHGFVVPAKVLCV